MYNFFYFHSHTIDLDLVLQCTLHHIKLLGGDRCSMIKLFMIEDVVIIILPRLFKLISHCCYLLSNRHPPTPTALIFLNTAVIFN